MTDLVYMGINRWHSVRQRPQQLALGLARSHRVLYVNPMGPWRWGKTRRIGRGQARAADRERVVKLEDNLYLYDSPLAWFPFNYHLGVVNRLNHWLGGVHLKRILSHLGWQNDWLWTSAPNHVDMTPCLPTHRICYDCMDLYHSFWSNRRRKGLVEQQESRLLAVADLVLVSSQALREYVVQRGAEAVRVHLVRNGVQAEHFTQEIPEQDMAAEVASLQGPVAGYVGTISHWFDMALILELLAAVPDLSVVCVGPAEIDLSPYRETERLYLLGPRPYEDLPRYLARFDVLLIPFIINELVNAVNPVKVYEYLATGKPVVSSAMRELQALDHVCYLAPDHQSFIDAVSQAMVEKQQARQQEEMRARRRATALENCWERRVEQINGMLEQSF